MATPKILIVEDEAVTRNTLKGTFEAEAMRYYKHKMVPKCIVS